MKLVAIVPAYNEEETIGDVVRKIRENENVDEVYVIDDDSTDNTAEVARKNGARVIEHVVNQGYGPTIQTGHDVAKRVDADYLIQVDADGQHDPKHINKFIQNIDNNDIIIGSRYLNKSYKNYSWVRRAGINFFTKVINFLSPENLTDITSGYRLYKVESLDDLDEIRRSHPAVKHTLDIARSDLKVKEISVEMPERKTGKSHFDPRAFVKYPFRAIFMILEVLLYR